MDNRPTLTSVAGGSDRQESSDLSFDQAIFTSIRTPTGEGYRIIAASPGIRAEEKAEITRRSPSHDSLTGSAGEDPVGFSSYRLGSGRRVVAYHCHAGTEHTARGGARVYTRMLVVKPDDFRSCESDALRLYTALAVATEREGPLLKPQLGYPPLSVDLSNYERNRFALGATGAMDWVWALADAMLTGRRVVLVGAPQPESLLQWAMLAIPRAVRERVEASAGVQFSASRRLQFVLLPQIDTRTRQLIASHGYEVWPGDAAPPALSQAHDAWFQLLARWWRARQRDQIVELTTDICADTSPSALNRVAAICEDLDRLPADSPAEIEALSHRYGRSRPSTPAEAALLQRLMERLNKSAASISS